MRQFEGQPARSPFCKGNGLGTASRHPQESSRNLVGLCLGSRVPRKFPLYSWNALLEVPNSSLDEGK